MASPLPSTMRAVLVKPPGAITDLYIGEVPRPSPKPGEVLIRVHATAANRADILQRKGSYPPPAGASSIIGLECAGEVVEINPDPSTSSKWKIGDKVMALLPGGGYGEYATAHEGSIMSLPKGYDFEHAAAIPEAFLTAYQLVREVGKMSPGEIVLVHAAASGVGTSALQLISLFGGSSIVTAGKAEKIEFCKKLGASYGVNYREGDMVESIKAFLSSSNRSGVNLVLDPVGASYVESNFELLSMDGRWVLYATMAGGEVPKFPLRNILMKRISITGTTLRTRSNEYKAQLVSNFWRDTAHAFDEGKLRPIVDSIVPIQDIQSAHQRMEADQNIGKIILKFA